jgi:oligopeptide transport system substrate-binding protein
MDQLTYQIVRSSWVGDYLDPNTFFDLWQTNGGNNRTGWSNAGYDSLIEQSREELDRDKRYRLFQDMERILVEDEFPIIPLYIYVSQGMLNPKVKGWHENIRDYHPFKYLWLED